MTSFTKQQLVTKWKYYTRGLLYFTVVWNLIEFIFSLYLGYISKDISLIAFGIDSLIEILSGSLVLYHIMSYDLNTTPNNKTIEVNENQRLNPTNSTHAQSTTSHLFSLQAERRMTLLIGWLLIIFCLFASAGGIIRLVERKSAESTIWGLIVSSIALVVMSILWYTKTVAYVILNSSALSADARCSLGCIQLSIVLFIGSMMFFIWPNLWWVDSVTVILIGLLVGYEGFQCVKAARNAETFSGCGCCSSSDSYYAKYLRKNYRAKYPNWDVSVEGIDDRVLVENIENDEHKFDNSYDNEHSKAINYGTTYN